MRAAAALQRCRAGLRSRQQWRTCAAEAAAEAARHRQFAPPSSFGDRVKQLQFKIVDSTLREGEQFDSCNFSTHDRVYLAKMLDKLGVDYIEMLNPVASAQAAQDCRTLSDQAHLRKAKVLTHIRCDMRDVAAAVEAGVHGVNMYMATSEVLVRHSHKKGIDEVLKIAEQCINYVKKAGIECRFSCEDTFRSKLDDVLRVYKGVSEMGVDRVGVADTVGIATPLDAFNVVSAVRAAIPEAVGIEFHAHDDTGCALANALMAIEAGATHIDTTVLGIGERNGIVPLGTLLARLYTINKDATLARYNLKMINSLDKYVATVSQVDVPFNNCVTGSSAFTHKAGVHTKAVMSNPGSYEILAPEDFGVARRVNITNRITGWNALKARAQQLEVNIPDERIQIATTYIKNLADTHQITNEHVDSVLMSIASGPKISSSDFAPAGATGEMKEAAEMAAKAVRMYQEELAKQAIANIKIEQDNRPFRVVRLQGHIFDEGVLNKAMDICVEDPIEFDLVNVTCAQRNDLVSSAEIRLRARSLDEVAGTVEKLRELALGNGCQLLDIES
eukprot:TRINITY_DN47793_c0_g1_i1.p1 TRINITY_DN47793_c0_g1~~TRINITY_DN47793_c0_g1_i1.p1  ORF type:complete len:560 (+),score=216.68 TRINITY_DN47793_c0_g1_i1:66-1745(+)